MIQLRQRLQLLLSTQNSSRVLVIMPKVGVLVGTIPVQQSRSCSSSQHFRLIPQCTMRSGAVLRLDAVQSMNDFSQVFSQIVPGLGLAVSAVRPSKCGRVQHLVPAKSRHLSESYAAWRHGQRLQCYAGNIDGVHDSPVHATLYARNNQRCRCRQICKTVTLGPAMVCCPCN